MYFKKKKKKPGGFPVSVKGGALGTDPDGSGRRKHELYNFSSIWKCYPGKICAWTTPARPLALHFQRDAPISKKVLHTGKLPGGFLGSVFSGSLPAEDLYTWKWTTFDINACKQKLLWISLLTLHVLYKWFQSYWDLFYKNTILPLRKLTSKTNYPVPSWLSISSPIPGCFSTRVRGTTMGCSESIHRKSKYWFMIDLLGILAQ